MFHILKVRTENVKDDITYSIILVCDLDTMCRALCQQYIKKCRVTYFRYVLSAYILTWQQLTYPQLTQDMKVLTGIDFTGNVVVVLFTLLYFLE